MKKSEAKPGTKVLATYAPAYEEYTDEQIVAYSYDPDAYGDLVGVIRSKEARPGHVWVKWIEGEYLDSLDRDEDSDEDSMEIDLKILTLESDRDEIEKEFKGLQKQIKEKMKEAAKLVNEAGELAQKAHARSLESLWDASHPLIDAMDNNGWRSSSWGC